MSFIGILSTFGIWRTSTRYILLPLTYTALFTHHQTASSTTRVSGSDIRTSGRYVRVGVISHSVKFINSHFILRDREDGTNAQNQDFTEHAVEGCLKNPNSIIVSGPVAVVIIFAEWVRRTYKKTYVAFPCLASSARN